MEQLIIDGVSLTLSQEIANNAHWVGQLETMERLLACWLTITPEDLPLCPRLIGKPGVGKTTLAMSAAKQIQRPLYIYQCTMDTRPEDLLITPILGESGKIHYHASPVVSAMLKGGVCILDEGNRMSEKSWASLAPLLDNRRYIESVIAGIKVPAHPDFRCCVTMNDDASTYELPDYILSRIQPSIEISFPPRQEELKILQYNLPFTDQELLKYTVDFLQQAHRYDLDCSTRDGIHILRYTMKRLNYNKQLDHKKTWEEAVENILGYPPSEIEKIAKRQQQLRQQKEFSDFSEFFYDPEEFGEDEGFDAEEDDSSF